MKATQAIQTLHGLPLETPIYLKCHGQEIDAGRNAGQMVQEMDNLKHKEHLTFQIITGSKKENVTVTSIDQQSDKVFFLC